MADITMCQDMKCPMKFDCYRHTAPWNQWRQSIFAESPREEGKFYCEQFWDNAGRTLDEKFREYEKPEPSPSCEYSGLPSPEAYKNNIKS